MKGTPKAGAYTTIGKPSRKGWIVICEGWATGVSIHMATGHCVVVAFDCGNLLSVATKIRAALPEATLIMAADDDFRTEGNPGVTAAIEAARAVNGLIVCPMWAGDRGTGTDFNDLHVAEGLDAVRMCFEDPQPPGGDEPPDGSDTIREDKAASVQPPLANNPVSGGAEASPSAAVAPDMQWGKPLNLFAETPVPELRRGMVPEVIERYAFDQLSCLACPRR